MDEKYLRLGVILIICLLVYLAVSVVLNVFPFAGGGSPVPSTGPAGTPAQNLTPKRSVETPLSLGQPKNQTVIQGNSLKVTLNRTDLKGRVLLYRAGPLPRGAVFFPGNSTLQWTPDSSQAGVFTINFTARNGSLSADQGLSITVKPGELPDALNMTLKNFLDLAGRPATVPRGYPAGFDPEHVRVVHPDESIQSALDEAGQGVAVVVEGGAYPGRVVIRRPVTLWGLGSPVIDGEGEGSPVSIMVDGVTLDGFTLRNSGSSPSAAGIRITSNRNVIANNTCTGNQYGILLVPPTHGNLLTGNRILNNSKSGMYIPNSEDMEVRSNTIVNNRMGIEVEMSWYPVISGNTVSFNNGDGISLVFSHYGRISNNTIMSNTGSGLLVSQGAKNRITGNYIGKNGGNGIETRDFLDIALMGNQIIGSLDSLSLNFIENNTVRNQKGHGIVANRTNNLIEGNEVGNNNYGIYFTRSQNLARDNVIQGNSVGIYLLNSGNSTLAGNAVRGNTNGIKLDGKSSNNEFVSNLVTNSRNDGFSLLKSADRNTLIENTIANNSGTGLVNLGNNTLKDNSILNNTRDIRTS
jgi:parallel beta-helix repeat protein